MENEKVFAERLRKAREGKNLTQTELAEEMGYKNYTTVSKWESGSSLPRGKELKMLSKLFDLSTDYLLGMDLVLAQSNLLNIYNQLSSPRQSYVYSVAEEQLEEQNKVVNLSDYIEEDLYGYASAGTGQQVFDNPIESIRLHKSDVPTQHYDITLKVVGDSMEPAFKDGEYIFIKKTESLRNGQFGVFIINGESYLKKVYVEDDHLRLVSLNDKYEDLIFTADDGITLVGQVVL
ncbi:helix-turn-helix domain-containing protein [Aerococcaceae bacterium WGS1372]